MVNSEFIELKEKEVKIAELNNELEQKEEDLRKWVDYHNHLSKMYNQDKERLIGENRRNLKIGFFGGLLFVVIIIWIVLQVVM